MSRKHRLLLLSAVVLVVVMVGLRIGTFGSGTGNATEVYSLSIAVNDGVLESRRSTPVACDFADDDHLLVAGAKDGSACVWRLRADGAQMLATLAAAGSATEGLSLTNLCLSSDAHLVAMLFSAATDDRQRPANSCIRLWDFQKETSRTLTTFDDATSTIAIAPRGDTIAVAGRPHRPLRVIDRETARVLWTDPKMVSMIEPLAFSRQGELLAAGVDRGLRVYEARTGKLRRECVGHSGSLLNVAFTDAGSRVCAAGVGSTIYVWDLADPRGDFVVPLDMPSGVDRDYSNVTDLVVSPDSASLLAFVPRDELPDFWERLQNPPVPGIVQTTRKGSLIFMCPLAAGKASHLLLDTKQKFSRVKLARDGHAFAALSEDERSIGVWRY